MPDQCMRMCAEQAFETCRDEKKNITRVLAFELSGGQKRRVAIAGVLAMHPKVLDTG